MILKNKSFLYCVLTLALSWLFTIIIFQNPEQAKQSFALVMFIPLIVAFIFQRIPTLKSKNSPPLVSKRLTGKSIGFAILYPLIIVAITAIIDVIFGLSSVNKGLAKDLPKLFQTIALILPALLSAYGEEFGWRGYLLPTLNEKFNKLQSSLITGIVWMLFHMPVIFLLAHLYGLANPAMVTVVQGADVFFFSFAFAFLFFNSKHVLPVVVLHAVWNVFNPYILGDLYTDTQGIMSGNIFVQNGEGVMGLIVAVIFSIYFIYRLKADNVLNVNLKSDLKSNL